MALPALGGAASDGCYASRFLRLRDRGSAPQKPEGTDQPDCQVSAPRYSHAVPSAWQTTVRAFLQRVARAASLRFIDLIDDTGNVASCSSLPSASSWNTDNNA